MAAYPPSIEKLIAAFLALPGIGRKTAERLAFFLLYQPKPDLEAFATALTTLKDGIVFCQQCGNATDTNPCQICSSSRRNQSVICVVARPQELTTIERIGQYEGVYYVLGGVIDPIAGSTPDKLNIKNLLSRVSTGKIREVILAFNPDMAGETTMLYLTKQLKTYNNLKISRLARGLPTGSDIEYADDITIGDALRGRRDV